MELTADFTAKNTHQPPTPHQHKNATHVGVQNQSAPNGDMY